MRIYLVRLTIQANLVGRYIKIRVNFNEEAIIFISTRNTNLF